MVVTASLVTLKMASGATAHSFLSSISNFRTRTNRRICHAGWRFLESLGCTAKWLLHLATQEHSCHSNRVKLMPLITFQSLEMPMYLGSLSMAVLSRKTSPTFCIGFQPLQLLQVNNVKDGALHLIWIWIHCVIDVRDLLNGNQYSPIKLWNCSPAAV